MSGIYAKGTIAGKSETREIAFRVIERARWLGLPQADIDALGLKLLRHDNVPAKSGVGDASAPIYTATGTLEGVGFVGSVIAAGAPTLGANFLRELGFRVDWENEKLEKQTGVFDGSLDPWAFETLAQHTGLRYKIDLVNWHLTLYPADGNTVTVVPQSKFDNHPPGDAPKGETILAQQQNESSNTRDERIRNYLRVVHDPIGQDVGELTREVSLILMHQLEWESALINVDNPEISPSQRAACFHRLIEQGTQDALHGDPGEWQGPWVEDNRAMELLKFTAPERIARVVQRMRTEFPHIAAEFA